MTLPAFTQAAESWQQRDAKEEEDKDEEDIRFGKLACWKSSSAEQILNHQFEEVMEEAGR